MNIRQILSIGLFSACLFGTAKAETQVVSMEQMCSMQKAFPRIHAIDKDVEAMKAKIDKYVNHHITDPQWILSLEWLCTGKMVSITRSATSRTCIG